MKLISIILLSTGVASFQVQNSVRPRVSALEGFLDFKPFHGAGSASKEDLDEQYRIQQELVRKSIAIYILFEIMNHFKIWSDFFI